LPEHPSSAENLIARHRSLPHQIIKSTFLLITEGSFALQRDFRPSWRRLDNFRLHSTTCSYSEVKKRSRNQSSVHTLTPVGVGMLAHLRSTTGFNANYLMELSRNFFPMPDPVWKAKIRKITPAHNPNLSKQAIARTTQYLLRNKAK
jgi:hypothetical protein